VRAINNIVIGADAAFDFDMLIAKVWCSRTFLPIISSLVNPTASGMAFSPLPSPPPIESFKRIALIAVIGLFIIIVHPNSRIAYTHTNHNEIINERT
jgi:hypothetical protein